MATCVRTYVHAHTHTHTTTMVWKPMRPLLLFPSSHSPLLVPRHGSSYYFYYFIFPTPKAHTRIRTCTHCLCFATCVPTCMRLTSAGQPHTFCELWRAICCCSSLDGHSDSPCSAGHGHVHNVEKAPRNGKRDQGRDFWDISSTLCSTNISNQRKRC